MKFPERIWAKEVPTTGGNVNRYWSKNRSTDAVECVRADVADKYRDDAGALRAALNEAASYLADVADMLQDPDEPHVSEMVGRWNAIIAKAEGKS